MTSGGGSIDFDRAAHYYDAARGTDSPDTLREVELVASELRARRRVLEVGAGTGAMSLPLHRAGHRVFAIDLSMSMLHRLVERAGGTPPFPVARADATRLPFIENAFDAAIARWVLHLIPNWPDAIAEIARTVRPGGTLLVNSGGEFRGAEAEIRDRLAAEVGRSLRPVGLAWQDHASLDAAAERVGLRPRALPVITVRSEEPLAEFLDRIEENHFSWTWPLTDEERLGALVAVRPWAEERFGPLEQPVSTQADVVWRAYDLPEG